MSEDARSDKYTDATGILTTLEENGANETHSERSNEDEEKRSLRTILLNRENVYQKPFLCCCTRRTKKYPHNEVKTSKYNFLTFLPLNLMIQFSKMANVYFLILGLLELIKPISDAGGEPVMLVPLSFIILVSMMKDIVEDY